MANKFFVKKNLLDLEYNTLLNTLSMSVIIYATFLVSIVLAILQNILPLSFLQLVFLLLMPTSVFFLAVMILATKLKQKKTEILKLS